MNTTVKDILLVLVVGLCIVAGLAVLSFAMYSCAALPDESKNCVDRGGSWVVSENGEGRYSDYECQQ